YAEMALDAVNAHRRDPPAKLGTDADIITCIKEYFPGDVNRPRAAKITIAGVTVKSHVDISRVVVPAVKAVCCNKAVRGGSFLKRYALHERYGRGKISRQQFTLCLERALLDRIRQSSLGRLESHNTFLFC